MKGRLLILTEDHTEVTCHRAERKIIAHLSSRGFSTLLLEFPCDISSADIVDYFESKIEQCDSNIEVILDSCEHHGIQITKETLLSMTYTSLCNLMSEIMEPDEISNGQEVNVVEQFADTLFRYEGYSEKIKLIKECQNMMRIECCDVPQALLEGPDCPQLALERNLNLSASYKDAILRGDNCIAIVGVNHTSEIRRILEEEGLLDQVIFINLYSHRRAHSETLFSQFFNYLPEYNHLFRKRIFVDQNYEHVLNTVIQTLSIHERLMNGKFSSAPAITNLLNAKRLTKNIESELAQLKPPLTSKLKFIS